MTIPATGPVNLSAVGSEISLPLLSPVSMNDTEVRKLANKTTENSMISMNDFHGTSYGQGGGYGDLDFTNVIDQFPNTTITSNVIYIVGAGTTPVSFAIFATLASEYSINGGAWTSKSVLGSIKNGDTLQLRTLSGTYASVNTVTAQFNGVTKAWSATVGVENFFYAYFAVITGGGTTRVSGTLTKVQPVGYTTIDWPMSLSSTITNGLRHSFIHTGQIAPQPSQSYPTATNTAYRCKISYVGSIVPDLPNLSGQNTSKSCGDGATQTWAGTTINGVLYRSCQIDVNYGGAFGWAYQAYGPFHVT